MPDISSDYVKWPKFLRGETTDRELSLALYGNYGAFHVSVDLDLETTLRPWLLSFDSGAERLWRVLHM